MRRSMALYLTGGLITLLAASFQTTCMGLQPGGPAMPHGPALAEVDNVRSLAISPDGKLVATCWGNPRGVGIWDIASGKPSLSQISGYFEQLAFSADSKKLIGIGSTEDQMAIWEVASGKVLATAKLPPWTEKGGGPGFITLAPFLTLSADGKHAVAIYNDNKVASLQISDAKLDLMSGDIKYFRGAAYSPSLDVIAVGLEDQAHSDRQTWRKRGLRQDLSARTRAQFVDVLWGRQDAGHCPERQEVL